MNEAVSRGAAFNKAYSVNTGSWLTSAARGNGSAGIYLEIVLVPRPGMAD